MHICYSEMVMGKALQSQIMTCCDAEGAYIGRELDELTGSVLYLRR